jgi:hypothetical protein
LGLWPACAAVPALALLRHHVAAVDANSLAVDEDDLHQAVGTGGCPHRMHPLAGVFSNRSGTRR